MENKNYISLDFSMVSSIANSTENIDTKSIVNFLFDQYFAEVNKEKLRELIGRIGIMGDYVFIDNSKIYFFNPMDGYIVKNFLNIDSYTSFHSQLIKE